MSQEDPIVLDSSSESDSDAYEDAIERSIEANKVAPVDHSVLVIDDDDDEPEPLHGEEPNREEEADDEDDILLGDYLLWRNKPKATLEQDDDTGTLPLCSQQDEEDYADEEDDGSIEILVDHEPRDGGQEEDEDQENVLCFDWRKQVGLKQHTSSTLVVPRQYSNDSFTKSHSTKQINIASLKGEEPGGDGAPEDDAPKKRKTKRPRKGAKTNEEQAAIALALGKHRKLEVQILCSLDFLKTPVGGGFEYFLIEHERQQNLKREETFPNDLIAFRRHTLETTEDGIVYASPVKHFLERGALIIWQGDELVRDLLNGRTKRNRLESVSKTFDLIQNLRKGDHIPGDPIGFLIVILDCDSAIARHRLSPKILEDFLVMDVNIDLGVSHCHVKTPEEAAQVCFEYFMTVEKWPYRKSERGSGFLDNIKRFKTYYSSSVQQEVLSETRVNGTELLAVWTNQLRCFPRISGSVAESVVQQYPSFRSLLTAIDTNPDEVKQNIQQVRKEVRREVKLAREVCNFFVSDDPDERLSK